MGPDGVMGANGKPISNPQGSLINPVIWGGGSHKLWGLRFHEGLRCVGTGFGGGFGPTSLTNTSAICVHPCVWLCGQGDSNANLHPKTLRSRV